MKPTCPECNSEELDQGTDGKILCRGKDCGAILVLTRPEVVGT